MSLKIKKITIALLSLLLILSMLLALSFVPNQKSVLAQAIDSGALVEEDVFVVNDRKAFSSSKEIEYKEGLVTAGDAVMVFPNGEIKTITDGKYITFTDVGTYTIKYFYYDGAELITFKDSFVVKNSLYAISETSASSITAVAEEDMKDETYVDLSSNVTASKNDGLILRMKDGVKFTYAEPIDLRDKSEDGLTNIITLDPRIAETAYGGTDYIAKRVEVTLTDCYDPTIFMTITMWSQTVVYIRANMDNMQSRGLVVPSSSTFGDTSTVIYGSERGIVWLGTYGNSVSNSHGFYDYRSNITFRYDYDNGLLYAGQEKQAKSNVTGKPLSGSTLLEDTKLITKNLFMDFNDPQVTGVDSVRSFTTGEVMVSVSCTDYKKQEPARVDILSIGNKNAGEFFDVEPVYDTEDPSTIIDYECTAKDYEDTLGPKLFTEAKPTSDDSVFVGLGDTVSIPSAHAYDINLAGDVNVAVYRNYGKPNVSNVFIRNNSFVADKLDKYYIVYTVKDSFGNVTEEVLKVIPEDYNGENLIVLDNSTKIEDNQQVANKILLPLGNKITTRNNYADLKLKIEIISDKESFVIADLKNGNEIDEFWTQETYFMLNYAGEYKVRYTYSDNVYSYVTEDEFTAVASNTVLFESEPFIPRLLLKDATYAFETVNAIAYDSGEPVVVGQAELYISKDGGDFTKISDLENVKIDCSSTVQLKAVYAEAFILSDVAPVKDVNYTNNRKLNAVNYFHSADNTIFADQDSSNLILKTTKSSGNEKLEFANIIDYSNFYISYYIQTDYSYYSAIKFTLTDPYDLENKVEFKLYKQGLSVYFTDGIQSFAINDSFGSTNKKEIRYIKSSKTLTFSGSDMSIIKDINFSTVEAYLDIELCDITGNAGVRIDKLNNQSLKRTTSDIKGPTASFDVLIGSFAIGDVITLPVVSFYDELSVVKKSTIITSFIYDRKVAQKSVDGITLDGVENDSALSYDVLLNSQGKFYFNFNAEDGFGNSGGSFNIVEVTDRTAPTITFNGPIKEDVVVTIKPGQAIKLDFTLSDNVTPTADLKYTIIVVDIWNVVAYGDNGTTIWFDEESKYEVSIICVDRANNVAIKSFIVMATKGGND